MTELRARLRRARREVVGVARTEAERRINDALVGLEELAAPTGRRRVALSMPTDGEVDLGPAMHALCDAGWQVHLPVVGAGRSMQFAPWEPGAALAPNRYGIPEPAAGRRRPASELDVVVLPCVGVDVRGHRLGFGAGFYDRALAETGGVLLIAAVFEAQVVERIDPAPHDVPVKVVVTESAVRRMGDGA